MSGGCDSIATTRVLLNFLEKVDLKLEAVHFHHGIRKKSDYEAEFVLNFCKKMDLKCHLIKTKHLSKPSIQKKARDWRYTQLEKLRIKQNFQFIVIGQHLNDLVETQIWRMLRGTSFFDFFAISPKQGYYLRPLLYSSKIEIKNYLNSINQQWIEDESNEEENYTRNYIRNKILPLLETTIQKDSLVQNSKQFLQKMLNLHQESLDLNQIYQELIKDLVFCDWISFEKINSLPNLFAKKLIHDFLISRGVKNLLRSQIENVYKLVLQKKNNWRLELHGNKVVSAVQKKILVIEKK